MPIRVLGASMYIFYVLGHVGLNFFDSKLFFEASIAYCVNMLYVACYNYDANWKTFYHVLG